LFIVGVPRLSNLTLFKSKSSRLILGLNPCRLCNVFPFRPVVHPEDIEDILALEEDDDDDIMIPSDY